MSTQHANVYTAYYDTLGEVVYYRKGDPRVFLSDDPRLKCYPGTDERLPEGRLRFGLMCSDRRPADQKAADQLAGSAEWQAKEMDRRKKEADQQRVNNWRDLFHTPTDIANAPGVTFAIDQFLPENGITMIGGLSGDGKTLIALDMCRTLLDGDPLFGHFRPGSLAERVVYLIPESGLAPFAHRLKLFHLDKHVGKRFFCRTIDSEKNGKVELTDPAMLKAVQGADVILDTAVRFMPGDENSASDQREFANTLFQLIGAGARTITGIHHSPKAFDRQNYMALENVLRGSGDVGAMLAAAWGVAKVDQPTTRLYLENVKARDFNPDGGFLIEGRPYIDADGHFRMIKTPGTANFADERRAAGGQVGGRPVTAATSDNVERAKALRADGKSQRAIAEELGVSASTVNRLLDAPDVGF
jgi:hypothetical protein